MGPVHIRLESPATHVGLADVLAFAIVVSTPAHVAVRAPNIGERLGAFLVVEWRARGADTVGHLRLQRWDLRLEPLATGRFELPPLSFSFREGGTETPWQEAAVPLPTVEVAPGRVSPREIGSLRPFPRLPDPRTAAEAPGRLGRGLRWLGVGLAAGVAFAWLWRHLSQTSASALPRHQALEELDALAKRGEMAMRQRLTAAADTVRRYLERAYQLDAPRQTTPEFLSSPQTQARLSANQQTVLAAFLATVDRERFVAREPVEHEWLTALQLARGFLAGEPAAPRTSNAEAATTPTAGRPGGVDSRTLTPAPRDPKVVP